MSAIAVSLRRELWRVWWSFRPFLFGPVGLLKIRVRASESILGVASVIARKQSACSYRA